MCPVAPSGVGEPRLSKVPLEGVWAAGRRPLVNVGTIPFDGVWANWPRPRGVIKDIAGVGLMVSHGGLGAMVTLEELLANLGSLGSMFIL